MRDIVKVFKALSNETRLRMLMLIERQELCVCEVEQILGMGQSGVSHHLSILSDAGLAETRRQGTWMFYRSAGSGASPYRARVVEILREWTRDGDLVGTDLANLKKCVANRGKNGHCPPPEADRQQMHNRS